LLKEALKVKFVWKPSVWINSDCTVSSFEVYFQHSISGKVIFYTGEGSA
jgi:hypothetical protein